MLPQYFSYIAPVFQLPQKGGNAAFSMYQYDEAINSLTWIYFKIETLERYVENFATTELHLKAYLLINYGFGETAGSKEKVRHRESIKVI